MISVFDIYLIIDVLVFFFQAEDGIRDYKVTGVQTCALPSSGETCTPEHSHSPTSTARKSPSSPPATAAKIGRASCRERGKVSVGNTASRRTAADRDFGEDER